MFDHNNISDHIIGNLVNATAFNYTGGVDKDRFCNLLNNNEGRLIIMSKGAVGKVESKAIVDCNRDEKKFIKEAQKLGYLPADLTRCCLLARDYPMAESTYECLKDMGFDVDSNSSPWFPEATNSQPEASKKNSGSREVSAEYFEKEFKVVEVDFGNMGKPTSMVSEFVKGLFTFWRP